MKFNQISEIFASIHFFSFCLPTS